jgi:hypothetical protein
MFLNFLNKDLMRYLACSINTEQLEIIATEIENSDIHRYLHRNYLILVTFIFWIIRLMHNQLQCMAACFY